MWGIRQHRPVTMSHENVELARRGLEQFLRTGKPPWDYIDPEIEIHDHDVPDGGTYHGSDGFLVWIGHWAEAWESFAIEPEQYADAGDRWSH